MSGTKVRIAACGIACEVCSAYVNGKCSGCTIGVEALEKLEEQRKFLGFTCPILECAFKHRVSYCTKDCIGFPCAIYYDVGTPYSAKFLETMKKLLGK